MEVRDSLTAKGALYSSTYNKNNHAEIDKSIATIKTSKKKKHEYQEFACDWLLCLDAIFSKRFHNLINDMNYENKDDQKVAFFVAKGRIEVFKKLYR